MNQPTDKTPPLEQGPRHWRLPRAVSLRWKLLVGVSLILIIVNGALALLAYRQLNTQLADDRAAMRDRQAAQLQALFDDRARQLSQLANLVPRLAQDSTRLEAETGGTPALPATDALAERLRAILADNGDLLELEWDLRTAHFIALHGQTMPLWPDPGEHAPAALVARYQQAPEQLTSLIECAAGCRQYLAAPVLAAGTIAGALVLGRSVADTLLAFKALTGADVALLNNEAGADRAFPATTASPMLRSWLATLPKAQHCAGDQAHTAVVNGEVFEWFHAQTASGPCALIVNRITEARRVIAQITRDSLALGALGLLASEALLLLLLHQPLRRLRRLARLLPLLAEERFDRLARCLPPSRHSWWRRDEMDLLIDTVRRLNRRLRALHAVRDRARRHLQWQAEHDALTDLPNRRYFQRALTEAIDRAQHTGQPSALLFFDLDRFKDINDLGGHPLGDRLLRQLAERLRRGSGQRGVLSHFGGDEFALLVSETDLATACRLAENLQREIGTVTVPLGARQHSLSASIGIVAIPAHGSDPETLMANADLAMYEAKARGRGRAHCYSAADTGRDRAHARLLWSERIESALREGRFELHYQPLLHLPSKRIWRAEALLRLRERDGTLVAPGIFVPIAEETGLIRKLDRWVITNAIVTLSRHPGLALAANLSAASLRDADLPAILAAQLACYPMVAPERLTLEVTETLAIDNVEDAVALITAIRALGCRFALDDFGSGFASYAYLKRLPVDTVKIDGAFVRDLDHNPEDRIFVKAITDMAHLMGKQVVAEFVESVTILEVLRELGVDFAQGYHIGCPQPVPPLITE